MRESQLEEKVCELEEKRMTGKKEKKKKRSGGYKGHTNKRK